VHLGAVFNLSHTLPQLGPFRPPIRSETVAGLYWVGGAVHPGSGLMTILEAAKHTAQFVRDDLPLDKPNSRFWIPILPKSKIT
jgi:phytoene desaturase